jgi:hypothetical protein
MVPPAGGTMPLAPEGEPAKIPPICAPSGDARPRCPLVVSFPEPTPTTVRPLVAGADMAAGRGDDSEANPYREGEGPARAPRT